MAQFIALNTDVEVNGQTVLSIVDGLGAVKSTALKILADNGLEDPKPDNWYSQQKWLNAFKAIAEKIGQNTLTVIGKKIPENAQFPPEIDDIHKALGAIDVAYHMNHRLNGEVLFNPATGEMKEGIGHYTYEKIDEKKAKITCDNPYPCAFDLGIIQAMAERFKPEDSPYIEVRHDKEGGCRKENGDTCTYFINW